MKKAIIFFSFLCAFNIGNAQQLFFEVFSGANVTAYEPTEYESPQWYVPIGIRIAGGHEHVQLGVEYRKNLRHPSFDTDILREEFDQTYKGLFLRGNFSSLPAYRFGLVLKAGAGYYETTYNSYTLPTDALSVQTDLDKNLGYNAGIGISSPIHTLLHWEIGYQFNYVDHSGGGLKEYNASYHSFQMGLSLNLVFGNTAKKCRRVISSGTKRGW